MKTQMMVEADHGDRDGGDAPEFDVVQFEIRIGVAAEEEAVLDGEAGVVGGLADLHPALFDGGGNKVDGGEPETESDGYERS